MAMEGELRVQGCLNLSRSFGDVSLKPDIVTAEPGVAALDLDPATDAVLLIGCDGLWDHISPDDAAATLAAFVQAHSPDRSPPPLP